MTKSQGHVQYAGDHCISCAKVRIFSGQTDEVSRQCHVTLELLNRETDVTLALLPQYVGLGEACVFFSVAASSVDCNCS